jgi:hypothetical protein
MDRRFDLVMSLEVAEHLPHECAELFVNTLVSLGPVVLFSAAIPGQGGTHHLNEQWPDYWAGLFQSRDYAVVDCIRKRIWQNDRIASCYAQNTLVFSHRAYRERHPTLKREYEKTPPSQLSLVHPKQFRDVVESLERLYRAAQEVAALVPAGDTLVLVDEDQLVGTIAAGRRALPFLDRGGQYWGPPADDETAVRELVQLRHSGASFIVCAWPAFWWLDYYVGLHRHLRSEFRCVLENDRLVVFDLRP